MVGSVSSTAVEECSRQKVSMLRYRGCIKKYLILNESLYAVSRMSCSTAMYSEFKDDLRCFLLSDCPGSEKTAWEIFPYGNLMLVCSNDTRFEWRP